MAGSVAAGSYCAESGPGEGADSSGSEMDMTRGS
jgi:hypothetical protein